jgi:hypothetical protein
VTTGYQYVSRDIVLIFAHVVAMCVMTEINACRIEVTRSLLNNDIGGFCRYNTWYTVANYAAASFIMKANAMKILNVIVAL